MFFKHLALAMQQSHYVPINEASDNFNPGDFLNSYEDLVSDELRIQHEGEAPYLRKNI